MPTGIYIRTKKRGGWKLSEETRLKMKEKIGVNSPNWKGGLRKLDCIQCENQFFVKSYAEKISKFCSHKCYWNFLKGKISGVKGKTWKIKDVSKYFLSNKNKNLGRRYKLSEEICKQHRETSIQNDSGRYLPHYIGKNHPNWKGGITSLNINIRMSFIYKELRKRAMQRDDYICQNCNERGKILNVNHKKPFALILKENNIKTLEQAINCVELWNLDNLETLCIDCHKKTDTYGFGTIKLLKTVNI